MGVVKILRDEIEYYLPDAHETPLAQLITQNNPTTFLGDGSPLSYFCEDIWDYSPYREKRSNRSKAMYKVDFGRIESARFKDELKLAFYVMFNINFPLEMNAIAIANQAKAIIPLLNSLSTFGIFSFSEINPITLFRFLESIRGKFTRGTIERKLNALNVISKLNLKGLEFSLPIRSNKSEFNYTILGIAAKYGLKADKEQTLYIPIGVHQQLMEKAIMLIDDAETELNIAGVKVTKLEAFNSVIEKRWFQIQESYSIFNRNEFETDIDFQNALTNWRNKKFGTLSEQLESAGIKGVILGEEQAKNEIFGYLGRLFAASVILLLSFTAMRYDELKTLRKRDAFITKKFHDTTFHYVVAFESKITGGEEVDYISAPIARKAVEIIDKLHQSARNVLKEHTNNEFLMFSHEDRFLPKFRSYGAVRTNLQRFVSYYDIKISDNDRLDNRVVNKNRKGLDVGNLWPISSHQFRRTLVVNFISHKIADIDAIKQQAKHMYQQMTQYYGNNAHAAQAAGLRTDVDLMAEITDAVVEANCNLFTRFHMTDETLGGKKGQEIMMQRENMNALTEEEIKTYVEVGFWNVSLSPFGYCTKGKDCSKTNIIDPSSCSDNCETTILTIDNAIEWRKLYRKNMKLMHGGLLDGYQGLMQQIEMQNRVALKIMKQFNLPIEEACEV